MNALLLEITLCLSICIELVLQLSDVLTFYWIQHSLKSSSLFLSLLRSYLNCLNCLFYLTGSINLLILLIISTLAFSQPILLLKFSTVYYQLLLIILILFFQLLSVCFYQLSYGNIYLLFGLVLLLNEFYDLEFCWLIIYVFLKYHFTFWFYNFFFKQQFQTCPFF